MTKNLADELGPFGINVTCVHPGLTWTEFMQEQMEQQGEISESEYQDAIGQGLGLDPGSKYSRIRKPYIFDLVKQELQDRYGVNTVQNGGLKVYTRFDPDLQRAAERAIQEQLDRIEKSGRRSDGDPLQGALIAIDPATGLVRALVGGRDFGASPYDRARQARRQPAGKRKARPTVDSSTASINRQLRLTPSSERSHRPAVVSRSATAGCAPAGEAAAPAKRSAQKTSETTTTE